MSLAAVLHHANHTLDSIVLLHSAIDTCEEYSVYHFLLGNLYAVSAPYSSVDSFFFLTKCTIAAQCSVIIVTFDVQADNFLQIWIFGSKQWSNNNV